MVHSKWLTAAAAAAALVFSSGCFKSYVVVSFRAPEETAGGATANVSHALGAGSPTVRTVAVRAPFGCALADPAPLGGSATGVALRSRAIIESRCETWLSELEKALAARFTVVGWRELARAERAGRADAARAAGAELVLAVTELQAEPLLVSAADPAAVRLERATPRGEALPPGKPLSAKEELVIRSLAAARYPDGALVGVRASLEIAAVPVGGGEPLFTYRGLVTDGLSGALESRMLVRGRSRSWRPVVPRGWKPELAVPAPVTPAEDPVRARVRDLAAAVAADIVSSFPNAS